MSTKKKRKCLAAILVKDRNIYAMEFQDLLTIVDKLFPCYIKKGPHSYNYTIGKFPMEAGWVFNVVNSWQKWLDKKYEHQFGGYVHAKFAVAAFLKYVIDNNINVKALCDT